MKKILKEIARLEKYYKKYSKNKISITALEKQYQKVIQLIYSDEVALNNYLSYKDIEINENDIKKYYEKEIEYFRGFLKYMMSFPEFKAILENNTYKNVANIDTQKVINNIQNNHIEFTQKIDFSRKIIIRKEKKKCKKNIVKNIQRIMEALIWLYINHSNQNYEISLPFVISKLFSVIKNQKECE